MHTPFKYPISPSISQQILRLDWSGFIRSLVRLLENAIVFTSVLLVRCWNMVREKWQTVRHPYGAIGYEAFGSRARSGAHLFFPVRGIHSHSGVSWPSGLACRTQVLVLAAECGFESRPWHLCPWARHLIIIASLHPGVKWVPVRAELVD